MSNTTMQAQQLQRIEFQKRMLDKDVWCSCLNCYHWNLSRTVYPDGGVTEHLGCDLAEHATPPPEVLVHGCPLWEYDIPF